jgi:hypothetical protein
MVKYINNARKQRYKEMTDRKGCMLFIQGSTAPHLIDFLATPPQGG